MTNTWHKKNIPLTADVLKTFGTNDLQALCRASALTDTGNRTTLIKRIVDAGVKGNLMLSVQKVREKKGGLNVLSAKSVPDPQKRAAEQKQKRAKKKKGSATKKPEKK